MQNAQTPSGPTLPRLLFPLVLLLRWGRRHLHALLGRSSVSQRNSSDVGGALLLVATVTGTAMLGVPPLLTVGGGVGLAVLFVVARSWVIVQEQQAA